MKNFIASVAMLFLFSFVVSAQGTNNSCSNAAPFCTGTQFDFPGGTGTPESEVGPDYGCLGSEPNPAWYFLQIADAGTVNIDILGTNDTINSSPTNDIDFICYGPFTSLLNVCDQLTAANTVDCSYSGSATEQVNIPNGQQGEYYMLLLTNFSNTACNIIFSQGSGSGSTSCGPFNNGPLCTGQDLQLLSFFNDAEVSFNWSGPNGFTSTESNPIIPNITEDMAGTYTLVTTNLTDTITGTTVVEIYPSPNASGYTTLGDSCTGGSLVFTPDSVFSNATYTWTYPDGSTFTGNPYTDNNIDSSLVTGVTLTYEIDGCFSPPVLQTINIYPLPVPIVIGDSHTCHDELSTISCTQNFISYSWNNGVTQPFIESNQGTYTITVVDEFGCVGSSAPFTITNSDPQAQINGTTQFCEGDSIQLDASGPYATYLWYPTPEIGAAIDSLTTNDSLYWDGGLLSLVVTDTMGCVDTLNANIPFTPNPVAEFTYLPFEYRILVNTPIQFADQTTFPASDPLSTWNWEITSPLLESNEQNPLIAFPDTGIRNIFLTVTSDFGCVDTITHQIYIVDTPFVPNAFSPGGDGYNDYLKIPFLNGYPGNSVAIFNRWGKKVYESVDYKNDWNGDELPSGTYFYVVSAPKLEKELKGTITLIRN